MSRYLMQRALCHPALPISRKVESTPVRLSRGEQAFYAHLGADADVQLEPGINQDEFFDDQFERRAHELQRTPGADNAVNVIPAKTGPWTGNNNLGIERYFSPDSNNRQTILKLPEWGFPEMWSLCLGLYFDAEQWNPGGGLTPAFDVTAIIEFGGGGCIQTVECDWVNGAAICLPMNAVNVIAQYNFDAVNEATDPSQPPLDLRLRANIVRNEQTLIQPTRTFKIQPDPIDPVVVNIPPFARRMMLIPSRSVLFTTLLPFYAQLGGVRFMSGVEGNTGISVAAYLFSQFVEYISLTDAMLGPPAWVMVPTGARSVSIEPASSGIQVLVVFEVGV